MKCQSCDKPLSDFEATRKVASTGHYLDLCNACYAPIAEELVVIERQDLITTQDVDEGEHDPFGRD